jgi:predicted DNA-binding transcriptional regulator YafY
MTYSPTIRLLTVLELLQSHTQMSGSEIARRLEVDKRTVRRYITQLQDMGIPIEAERGPYGAYQIERGYKLPPMMFTDAEAVALTLGLLAIREFRFPVEAAAVEGALAKAERVMPELLLKQARALQQAITFNVPAPPVKLDNNFVVTLSSAVACGERLFMRYTSWPDGATEREFDPYGIVFHEGLWYTGGYCHLRRDMRTFRLDRMQALEPTGERFERPDDFDALEYVMRSLASVPGTYQVEIMFDATLDEMRQLIPLQYGALEATPDGVLFRRQTTQLSMMAHLLVGAEAPVKWARPPELIEAMHEVAARLLRIGEPAQG